MAVNSQVSNLVRLGGNPLKFWLGISMLTVSSACVAAAEPAYEFSITAKPLPQALSDFSRVTGQGVMYTQDAPYSVVAPALSGSFTAEQPLRQLLGKSGLGFRRATLDTFTLEPAASSDGTISLGLTQIDSQRDRRAGYPT